MEFVKPEMERILFDSEDVIVTSGGTCTTNCPNDGSTYCDTDNADVPYTGILN